MKRTVLFLTIAFCVFPIAARGWSGLCVKVADGDTITVLNETMQKVRVRLYGIDAPEKRQDFGQLAKRELSRMAGNKTVIVEPFDVDRYGRVVGLVYVDGIPQSVNEMLIGLGMAMVYRKYCVADFCERWAKIEKQCRAQRVGLWSMDAMAPWEWRRQRDVHELQELGKTFRMP